MYSRIDRAHRAAAVFLGVVTLLGIVVLFTWDIFPTLFPEKAHNILGAFPLGMIAVAYLVYQRAHRPPLREAAKAALLAAAFFFWAANQLWPDSPYATLLNDIAIDLFVLDVFLVIVGWPATSPDESFAEALSEERWGKSNPGDK